MWIVLADVTTPAVSAPQATRALIEDIGSLSVASMLILLVFMIVRGTLRLDREVVEAHRERDEWRRLWEQERAAHRGGD